MDLRVAEVLETQLLVSKHIADKYGGTIRLKNFINKALRVLENNIDTQRRTDELERGGQENV
jgi:hypothetical protein